MRRFNGWLGGAGKFLNRTHAQSIAFLTVHLALLTLAIIWAHSGIVALSKTDTSSETTESLLEQTSCLEREIESLSALLDSLTNPDCENLQQTVGDIASRSGLDLLEISLESGVTGRDEANVQIKLVCEGPSRAWWQMLVALQYLECPIDLRFAIWSTDDTGTSPTRGELVFVTLEKIT